MNGCMNSRKLCFCFFFCFFFLFVLFHRLDLSRLNDLFYTAVPSSKWDPPSVPSVPYRNHFICISTCWKIISDAVFTSSSSSPSCTYLSISANVCKIHYFSQVQVSSTQYILDTTYGDFHVHAHVQSSIFLSLSL